MKTHDDVEIFECDECPKKIMFQWRMKKHMEGHIKTKVKCHYFNNGKRCPYEDVGFMFAHETAKLCKFRENCTKEKCQLTRKNMEMKMMKLKTCPSMKNLRSISLASHVKKFMMT